MKFREFFRFELTYQLTRIWPWIFFAVLLILNFLMARDASLSNALYEDFFANSPFAIAKTMVFGTLLWLLAGAVIAGDAATRDVSTRMQPISYSLPINKTQYLGGKFAAVLVTNTIILIAVPLAIILALYSPDIDPTTIAPFRAASYLSAFFIIVLPNMFVASAIQFALALWTGRAMAGYVGSLILFFLGFFIAGFILFKQGLGTYIDPIGIRFIVEDLSHLWTTVERNQRLISFEDKILINRLIWLGVGVITIVVSYTRFTFSQRTTLWSKKKQLPVDSLPIRYPATDVPLVNRNFGVVHEARQVSAIAWTSFKAIATSRAGLAMLIFIPLMTIPVVLDQMISDGVPITPTTNHVLRELTAPLSAELSRWVIIPLLIIFFAGELVWREREANVSDIIFTFPGSDWAPVLGKLLALFGLLITFTILQMGGGIIAQIIADYNPHNYLNEFFLYVKVLFGLQLTEYFLLAALALIIHVVINQKYLGHMVALVAYAVIALPTLFGLEHPLLIYSASPEWTYTEMRGFGSSVNGWLWFKSYWAAWAFLLLILAILLSVRGKETHLRYRLAIARYRLTNKTRTVLVVMSIFVIVLGSIIFYNFNVLNDYISSSEQKQRQSSYEKLYGKFKSTAQPVMVAATLKLEIFPSDQKLMAHGVYLMVNKTNEEIDSIHLAIGSRNGTKVIEFNRPTSLVVNDQLHRHQIYKLSSPLQPGDSIKLEFDVQQQPTGLLRRVGTTEQIVENGTFFTNALFPSIGYQANRELITPNDRREYGLQQRHVIPSLYDSSARKGNASEILVDVIIGTAKGQVAVSPGALVRHWIENDRSYYQYKTQRPIGSEWSFFSANYKVFESEWKPKAKDDSLNSENQKVVVKIFHLPSHTEHLEGMIESIKGSLDYYTKHFGPYRFNHLTVVEAPGAGTGIHADASMLFYSEGVTRWKKPAHPGDLDFPFAVIAHEVAHQWTVPYAGVEGAPVMSESIAWYYAMKAVENAKGSKQLQKLREMMRRPHPFPPIKRGEPLLRGLDPYLSYRRGPFALYTLSEYVGEQEINRALRQLLEEHRKPGAPLATTLDLYDQLSGVTADSLKYLLHDLFNANTYWEMNIKEAVSTQRQDSLWEVGVDVTTRKIVADSAGVDREIQMNDWIEIAIYTDGSKQKDPVYLEKHRILSGSTKILTSVSKEPQRVVIDPNHLMIEINFEDNTREIKKNQTTLD